MDNNLLDSSKQAQQSIKGNSSRKAYFLSITLKYLCLAIFCFDFYIAYNLVTLVMQFLHEVLPWQPDLILLMSSAHLLVSFLKMALCVYGFHHFSNLQDRTTLNYARYNQTLNLTTWIRVVVHAIIH